MANHMSKRDYINFAEVFNAQHKFIQEDKEKLDNPNVDPEFGEYVEGKEEVFNYLLDETIDIFKRDNSAFDENRFRDAVFVTKKKGRK